MQFPDVFDVEFSARCNLKCGFCFGPTDDRTIPDLPTAFWREALGWIRRRGARGIVVSGGEPTIHKDIVLLLSHAKQLGLSVVMSTHGQFRSRVLACVPYTDWIALPVDGVTPKMLQQMRGRPWSLDDAWSLIGEIKRTRSQVGIKLGTVANRKNLSEIPLLAREISTKRLAINTWKVYQYTPRRQFAHRAAEFQISDAEYSTLYDQVRTELRSFPGNVVFSSNASRRRAYVFVYPDGTVAIPNNGQAMSDLTLGNLHNEGPSVLDRIAGVDLGNHLGNYTSTYGATEGNGRSVR